MTTSALVAAALGVCALASLARADSPPPAEGAPPSVVVRDEPPLVIVRERRDVIRTWNAPLFGAGLVAFGIGYGGGALAAASSDDGSLDRLFVPVLGPWLALDQRPDCPITNPRCDRETSTKALLVADGVLQGAGVITMAAGLILPREYTVVRRDDTRVEVTGSVGPKMTGLIVKGQW